MEDKIESLKERKLLILLDNSLELNRAKLIAPASLLNYDNLNEFISLSYGMLEVCLKEEQTNHLNLEPMQPNSNVFVSIDAREGITTGISISDRLKAIKHLCSNSPDPRDLVTPGHIVPIKVNPGGVVAKNALPEAAFDMISYFISKESGNEGALISDLLNESGEFFTNSELEKFSNKHKIEIITLDEITRFFLKQKKLIKRAGEAKLPSTIGGNLKAYIYTVAESKKEHFALVKGDIRENEIVSVRVQVENSFEDIFGANENSSKNKINKSLKHIKEVDSGIFLYLKKGRNVEKNSENVASNMRNYGIGAQILRDLGAKKIRVISQSVSPLVGLEAFGLEIVENIAFESL